MQRVLVLGRGGSGKTTFATRLSNMSGLPQIELDSHFWQAGLVPLTPEAWSARQDQLMATASWIMDGDLGPYDVLAPRLRIADTIFLLDFPLWRCAWRSLLRGRERVDYWKWVLLYRLRDVPRIRQQVASEAPNVDLHILRRPKDVASALRALEQGLP
jgi:adenylate kinase family enzyme